MKILVTGGAGFIGSHIVDTYVAAGHRVVVIDNLSNGSRKNINSAATFYKVDIKNRSTVERIVMHEKPDVINHHAALISVNDSLGNPTAVYDVNVDGTMNLLRAFGEQKRGLFIFPSSAAVYGDPKKIPTPESTPLSPISPYGISKALGESLVVRGGEMYGFDYCIFRYSNAYGPRQNPKTGGVVAKVIGMLARGARPVMFGKGTNTRDYIYVDDIVRANMIALGQAENPKPADHTRLMNISSGKQTSDNALFKMIAEKFAAACGAGTGVADGGDGKAPKPPIVKPIAKGNIRASALSPARAKKMIGWVPTTSLSAGLAKTISSF